MLTAALVSPPVAKAADAYPINFPADATVDTSKKRSLTNIVLSSPSDGTQRMAVNQQTLLYHDVTTHCFAAMPGETVTASFDWSGNWMHGYVYLDRGNDGEFSHELGENSAIPEGSDVMAFSSYGGFNSAGVAAAGNVGVMPPSFTIPADLAPGLYRMRYKIDWNSIDPGGNDANGVMHQQLITANAGAIADVLLYLHDTKGSIKVVSDHGSVCDAEGVAISEAVYTPGEDLKLQLRPDAGFSVKSITVTSGYEAPSAGVQFASASLAPNSTVIPAYLIANNTVTIPGEYTYGNVTLAVEYVEGGSSEGGDYACSLTGNKRQTEGFMKITIGSGSTTSTAIVTSTKRHFFYEKSVFHAVKTQTIQPTVDYKGQASTINFYVDLNQDGVFSEEMGELLSTAPSTDALPSFTLPSALPAGVYRARMEAPEICAVDFLLNLHDTAGNVTMNVLNGYVMGANKNSVPNTVPYGSAALILTPKATFPGFEAEKVVVRHGHNLDGEQYVRGNRQWEEIEIPVGESTKIAAEDVDGDILITADFKETEASEWTAIWSDEFNGKTMDTNKWSYHPRYGSTWNRFIAQGAECEVVNKFENGMYNSWCIATPEDFKATETQPMISGAIYTGNKFYCTGGWIEARAKTAPHAGNFPAFWMMPQNGETWPRSGEIDIWEQINSDNVAHHTIHSAWGNKTLGQPDQESPVKTSNGACTSAQWHVYALEWDQDALKWYIDGELKFTYKNMHYSDSKYTEALSWPFFKPFYIILNQSVGDGSWASKPDTSFDYHTEFDYVRVYQKKGALDYYSTADGYVSGIEDVITDGAYDPSAPVEYYNLQGIRMNSENLTPGIYVRRQGSDVSKVMVR